jgi:uncharacterized protein (DUF3820 family)
MAGKHESEGVSAMNNLTDTSPMPFGKHKCVPMQDVPASYFHYLWTNGMKSEQSAVANYIRKNLDALKLEYKDGIWS